MANPARGPSLLQARDSDSHPLRRRNPRLDDNNNHRVRSGDRQLQERQDVIEDTLASVITEVVSVSVVAYLDSSGATVAVSTVPSAETTDAVLSVILTPAASILDSILPTSLPVASTDGASPLPTSAPLTAAAPYPISSGLFNSSISRSHSLYSNTTTTQRSLYANTTTRLLPSKFTSDSSDAGVTGSLSDLQSSQPSPTGPGSNSGAGQNGDGTSGPSSTSSSSSSSSDGSSSAPGPQTTTVVAGLVGGIAGVAILAFVLLFILKWKKRQANGLKLLADRDEAGGFLSRSHVGGGPPRGGAGGMTERSLPFAVPSALARLTSKRDSQGSMLAAGSGSGEKGFYRVSGRKLAPVLLSGGDGYSDPHDSVNSSASNYRDSMAMFGGPNSPQLQLGSPMRPESGVPIVRSGPARTPVTEQGPYFGVDAGRTITPPSMARPPSPHEPPRPKFTEAI